MAQKMQHIGFGHLGIVEYAPLSSSFIGQVKAKTHAVWVAEIRQAKRNTCEMFRS
jgi:hypothetical protein